MSDPIDPLIGIIYHRDKHPGANTLDELLGENGSNCFCDEVGVPLSEAITRTHEEDSHLILYTLRDKDNDPCWARLIKKGPFVPQLMTEGGRVEIPFVAFDFDLEEPDPLDPNKTVKREWRDREEIDDYLVQMDEAGIYPPTHFYTTLHGFRMVYVLTEPVSPVRAEGLLLGMMAHAKERGIEYDAVCKDWTRLFRLPITTRKGGSDFNASDLFVNWSQLDCLLDPEDVAIPELMTAAQYAEATPYDGEAPDPEEVRDLLETKTRAGRPRPTDWVRKAQTMLSGREAESVCFQHKPIDTSQGWNNGVLALVGQIVTMTARQVEATPEGVYALLFPAIEQLQALDTSGETDWFETTWSMVCRMWANELAQIAHENQQKQASIEEGKQVKKTLLEQLREERPQDVPSDEDEAEEWMQQRMIASLGNKHHVMTKAGNYNLRPVPDRLLIPMVRDLGMEDVIQVSEMHGKTWGFKSVQNVLNTSATPVTSMVCVAREGSAFIEGATGMRQLNVPVHRLNPKVRPLYSEAVDAWLQALGGEAYDLLVEWLSHALSVDQPICALNLYGSPGTGKGMLAQALAECFESEHLNDGRALGKWNRGLLETPIVFCDEGVPNLKSDESPSVDQAFRSLVSGGTVTIRAMNTDPFTARIYPRILFMSNDPDIIRSIVGHRDLTEDDVRAIELRLLSLAVDGAALSFLTSRGNYRYTSGWVHGKDRSKYIIASHIRWLWENRKPSAHSSGRLLVEGQQRTPLVQAMRLRSKAAQSVLIALSRMLNNPNGAQGLHVHEGHAWVMPAGIKKCLDSSLGSEDCPNLPQIGRVLRQYAEESTVQNTKVPMIVPPGADRVARGRWIELDLSVLYEESLRYGLDITRLKPLIRLRDGGEFIIKQLELNE